MPATTSPNDADDGVVLCHWGPVPFAPSMSSFVLKLETYLKMAEIPYKQEFTNKMSSKGKMPYIKLEGKEVPDSNFIISQLNTKFEKDLDACLSASERAVSLAFKRLIEENLYWTLVYFRVIENFPAFSKYLTLTGIRKRLFPIVSAIVYKPSIKSALQAHGIGRHSREEVYEIMEKDLKALSSFLSDKKFFFGDEPTEIDASLFGFLVQGLYALPESPHQKLIKESLPNLAEYTERMRERYWPNWEECCMQEKKKEEPAAAKEKTPEEQKEGEASQEKSEEKVEEKANGSGTAGTCDAAASNGAGDAGENAPDAKEANGGAEKETKEADPEK